MEGLPEYLDKYLDARFKGIETEMASIKETVRQAMENNARLVEMIQRELMAQGERMNTLEMAHGERMNALDAKIDELRKEIRGSRRFLAATFLAGLGVAVALMSLIFQVLK